MTKCTIVYYKIIEKFKNKTKHTVGTMESRPVVTLFEELSITVCFKPVSYTHLDVYKRQVFDEICLSVCSINHVTWA